MLEVKWKECYESRPRQNYTVSILVMLEVKWKDEIGFISANELGCFNPCYVGSKMERSFAQTTQNLYSQFQSLLCWK